jgi:hypothetical protein
MLITLIISLESDMAVDEPGDDSYTITFNIEETSGIVCEATTRPSQIHSNADIISPKALDRIGIIKMTGSYP